MLPFSKAELQKISSRDILYSIPWIVLRGKKGSSVDKQNLGAVYPIRVGFSKLLYTKHGCSFKNDSDF
jgi:hypothetical protein